MVLSRHTDDTVTIGDDAGPGRLYRKAADGQYVAVPPITITVVEIRPVGRSVKLGFDADGAVPVRRGEVERKGVAGG